MRFRTRFLLLLGFLFLGVTLTVWFGLRPNYEEAILNERITVISEYQRERVDLTGQQLSLWAAALDELREAISETADIQLINSLFSGISGLIPEMTGFRLIEVDSGEYLEFRSGTMTRLPSYDPADMWPAGPIPAPGTGTTLTNYFAYWDSEEQKFVLTVPFQLDDASYRLVGVFDSEKISDFLFVHQLGVPVRSVVWLRNTDLVISPTTVPDVRPEWEQVTRVHQTTVDGVETVIISAPMNELNAQFAMYLDPSAIQGPVRQLFARSLAITAVAFGVLALAAVFLFMALARPIGQFLDDVEPFAQYEFDRPFTPIAVPELHQVSIRMEEIRQKLAHYQRVNVEQIILNQERLNIMLQHATDLIAVFDHSGIFTFRNARFVELFLDLDEPAPGNLKAFEKLDFIKSTKSVKREAYQMESVEIRTSHTEVTINPGGEKEYYYDYHRVELYNEEGDRLGGQLMFYDLTHQRELDRLRNDMINIIVHELKNPISGIKGLTQALLDDDTDLNVEERAEIYTLIDSSAESLHRLVERFLMVSKLESDTNELELEPVDMVALLRETTREMRPILDEKQLELNIDIDSNFGLIAASADFMQDMMRNLISNAIKYGPTSRTIDIRLAIEKHESVSDVVFSVTDYGFGIPPKYRDQIFKKFYRIKEYDTEKGTGLGLSHVKEIMRKHGGDVYLESDDTIGSRFTARMPYKAYTETEISAH